MKRILIFMLLLCPLLLVAQSKLTVTGQVLSATDNESLIGVTVHVKGTTIGTVTDLDGAFSLSNVPQGSTLTFSMVGYVPQEVKAASGTVNIKLKENNKILDDVVVIGYGVAKKSDLTSSITSLKGDDVKTQTSGNVMYSLQGKANGVQVTGGGGPGATPRVIIRGVTTVNGSDPLYVVDGMIVGSNVNFLNQDDIESIEVLKDASATAIYGTRASNGVIIITTKKGGTGKTMFTASASFGVSTLKKPDVANAEIYKKTYIERYSNDGYDGEARWNANENIDNLTQTDWWKQVVNRYAYKQTYNIGFQGGNDKVTYSGSLGYFREGSQYDYGYWERITGRFNMDYKFSDKVKFGVDFAPRYENWEDTPNKLWDAMAMDPTTPVFRPESEWEDNKYNNYARSYHNQVWNPVAAIARLSSHSNEYGLMMNPYLSYNPIKELTVRSQFGINASARMSDSFSPLFYIDNLEQNTTATASRTSYIWANWNWVNTLNYMKTFNQKHNVNAMFGFTMEKEGTYWLSGSRDGVPSNVEDLQYVNAGTLNPKASGTNSYLTLVSLLGRVMYNYDNRYYLTGSIRRDGSSKFPTGNKYAVFPAMSVAWRLSEESFMKDQKFFQNLKIRAGWGRVGNQAIDSDAYINLISSADYVYGSDADRYVGTTISQVGNANLKWETVEDYNLGVDVTMFKNKLNITADVFLKKSHDMLMKKDNLLILGYPNSVWNNIGSMEAKGWEFSVSYRDKISDFRYDLGLNLSGVKNKAVKFASDEPIWGGYFNGDYAIKNVAGGEISRFYGYVADGLFQNQTEINSHTSETGDLLQSKAVPGDIRFKDLNHDGKIDANDKTWLGNAFPDLMIGFNMNLGYKDFDLVANFYGTLGNDIFNSAKASFLSGLNDQNVYTEAYYKAWRGEGTSTTIPRLSANDYNKNYTTVSSFFVENGSYFRCKLLQLGYTLPKSVVGQYHVRVSASAQNLFTITKYSGMDPERAAMGSVTSAGVDGIAYPNPRSFLLGLNINF